MFWDGPRFRARNLLPAGASDLRAKVWSASSLYDAGSANSAADGAEHGIEVITLDGIPNRRQPTRFDGEIIVQKCDPCATRGGDGGVAGYGYVGRMRLGITDLRSRRPR